VVIRVPLNLNQPMYNFLGSATTFNVTTLSINCLFATLGINGNQHNTIGCHYADCYSECLDLFIVMLNVVMLNAIMLIVVGPGLGESVLALLGNYSQNFIR
jgi:hypothetical protein